MRRTLWLFPLLLGIALGFAAPSESATSYAYLIQMLPPSGSAGQSPLLTCGFHGGSCSTSGGNYLDWDNTSTSYVYFRGVFKRSSSPYQTNRLFGRRRKLGGGTRECDKQEVRVFDGAGNLRGVMEYLHISTNAEGDFPIATSQDGVYNSKVLGSMMRDEGCGSWSGTHVHAGYSGSANSSRARNTSRFPTGDYCTPTDGDCKSYRNDGTSNWTHKFTWSGS